MEGTVQEVLLEVASASQQGGDRAPAAQIVMTGWIPENRVMEFQGGMGLGAYLLWLPPSPRDQA